MSVVATYEDRFVDPPVEYDLWGLRDLSENASIPIQVPDDFFYIALGAAEMGRNEMEKDVLKLGVREELRRILEKSGLKGVEVWGISYINPEDKFEGVGIDLKVIEPKEVGKVWKFLTLKGEISLGMENILKVSKNEVIDNVAGYFQPY